MKFKNHVYQSRHPFVLYCDLESLLENIDEGNKEGVKCYNTHHHIACSVAIQPVSIYKKYEPYLYRGKKSETEVIDAFYKQLEVYAKDFHEILKVNKPITMSDDQIKEHNKATRCYICKEIFDETDKALIKVKDHDHFTGEYRGAAHSQCNLKIRNNLYRIKVVFHNSKNYDTHFFVKQINKLKNVKVIAKTMEKYSKVSGTIKLEDGKTMGIDFLDSCQFLLSSLSNLASNLGENDFKQTDQHFGINSKLFQKKGIYPYSFMDNFEKFELREKPTKEDFYDHLKQKPCTDEEYKFFEQVWDAMKCENMGDYHDLYLYSDVTILADVFERFRDICLQYYELDPIHYITAPSLAFDAMLKMTKVEIELLTDENDYMLWERAVRGGNVNVVRRHIKANNKYLPDYDETLKTLYGMYLDAIALYSYVMCQKLPIGGFKHLNGFNINDIMGLDVEGNYGYLFVVDFYFPDELHDLLDDMPMAPEKKIITEDMLSKKAKKLKSGIHYTASEKLISSLEPKLNYPLHIKNLQYYISKGAIVTKIRDVIRFKQEAFMAPYIKFNISQRTKPGVTAFEKDFFKLMNNAVFGKTMENVRLYQDVKVCTKRKQYTNKIVPNPFFNDSLAIHENLVICKMGKKEVQLCKPVFIGVSILDNSKLHMYQFHYDVMIPKYGTENCQFANGDTDSLIYLINTGDIYEDLRYDEQFASHFDLSVFPETHFLHNKTNKGVMGKFKDEVQDGKSLRLLSEVISIRPKMYHCDVYDTESKQIVKPKQATKGVPRDTLTLDNFIDCLYKNEQTVVNFNTFRSKRHEIYSQVNNKIGLANYDDKRYLRGDGIRTYAYGHYKTRQKSNLLR